MPKTHKFVYNKSIDKKIIRAARAVLGVKISRAVKMGHGEVNHVYKLVAEKQIYLARIFQYKSWPEGGMLEWIEAQLTKHKIPRAKILYYSRGRKFFPFGFMITEFIEGSNGVEACKKGQISLAQAYRRIGAGLRQVHKIRIKKFGAVNKGKGNFRSYLAWKLKADVHRRFDKFRPKKLLPMAWRALVVNKVESGLGPFNQKLKPVLNHGDPNRENAIWSEEKQWVFIDWDNAIASTWLEDYADVSFWLDYKKQAQTASALRKVFVKNFFKGYGKTEFKRAEIYSVEHALHMLKCLRMLDYYYSDKKNSADFALTKKKLSALLK